MDMSQPTTAPLSRRQFQVLKLLRQGLTTKQVAKQLDVSPTTVRFHKQRIRDKAGLESERTLILLNYYNVA